MDIYTNFYLQVVLCIVSFLPVYLLMKSGDRLKKKLEDKVKTD